MNKIMSANVVLLLVPQVIDSAQCLINVLLFAEMMDGDSPYHTKNQNNERAMQPLHHALSPLLYLQSGQALRRHRLAL